MSDRSLGRVLVTGAGGLLGSELARHFSACGDAVGLSRAELDVSEAAQVRDVMARFRPAIVLHAAAYTSVDRAESETAAATLANVVGAMIVARECRAVGANMVYYSTDYVFDGESDAAYAEDAQPNPRNVYGATKLKGERAVLDALPDALVLRVAWLYGNGGRNFVRSIARRGLAWLDGDRREPMPVVDDQFANPTWTREVARQTEKALTGGIAGVCHAVAGGEATPLRWATRVFDALSMPVEVGPCSGDDIERAASRPRRSAMRNARLHEAGLNVMRDWQTALDEFLADERERLLHE